VIRTPVTTLIVTITFNDVVNLCFIINIILVIIEVAVVVFPFRTLPSDDNSITIINRLVKHKYSNKQTMKHFSL